MRHSTTLILSVVMLCAALPKVAYGKTEKNLSIKEARRVIARMAGIELKTDAIRVQNISSAGASTIVVADVATALRFRKTDDDKWELVGFRIGDNRWEEVDLFAGAIGEETLARARAELNAIVNDLAALPRENKKERELRRATVLVKDFSALLSSATVVAEIGMTFRLVRGVDNKWRVADIGFGDSEQWINVNTLLAAANAARNTRARAELEATKAALEAYRREHGFYVVADNHSVLIDYLSPRYLTPILRFDPWHRPYSYEGTRERYTLRSNGADGEAGTADDVTISNQRA